MAKLIVNCTNRPADEMIDCGVYGLRLNMHEYNLSGASENVVLGFPLEEGEKLPAYRESSHSKEPSKSETPNKEDSEQ